MNNIVIFTAHLLSASGLAWQLCLKKTEVKLELLTDNDMLLMVEKGIRGGICHAIHRYANMIKTKNHHIFNVYMQTICMDEKCLKNFLQMVLNGKKKC